MSYNFANVRVLVVESSMEMFQLIKGVLCLLSVPEGNIYAAYTVDQAFETFKEKKHDLVIVDWMQNPDRGIHLTRRLRTDQTTPNVYVPIIMTAGSGHESRVLRARDAGISEYLVKPFSANALAERISRIIETQRNFVISTDYTGPDRRVRNLPHAGEERRSIQLQAVAA